MTLNLAGGKSFTIAARNNGTQHPYIHAATLNGAALDRTYISHQEITAGGEVTFDMDSAPDYKWATSPEARPPALMPSGAGSNRAPLTNSFPIIRRPPYTPSISCLQIN